MKEQKIKFTFKKEPYERGLSSIGAGTPSTQIKFKGVEIGYIRRNDYWNYNFRHQDPLKIPKENKWQVHIQKEDSEQKSGWKWVTFSKLFETEPEAREYVNKIGDYIYTIMYKGGLEEIKIGKK